MIARDIPCPLCGKPTELYCTDQAGAESTRYQVRWCSACAIASTYPFTSTEERKAIHAIGTYRLPDGGRFLGWIERLVGSFSRAKRSRIRRYVQCGSILDVGCGRGLFLRSMADQGWTVTGIEIDEDVAQAASSAYGIPAYGQGAFWHLAPRSFDVITIFHALEHMDDPVRTIDQCKALLKQGGLLVISVPNFSSPQSSWGKCDWLHLDLPAHLFHFTSRGLEALLHSRSFQIVHVRHFDAEQNIFGWLQTILNRSSLPKNWLFQRIQRKQLRDALSPLDELRILLVHAVLIPFYLPLALFLATWEALIGRNGGTVEIHAVSRDK